MMMRKLVLMMAFAFLPMMSMAQNDQSPLGDFIAQANAHCPIAFIDGWTVESFTCENDTVTIAITVAGEAANYLPMMAANADRMKKMWVGQLSQYGEHWNNLVDLIAAENKFLVVLLQDIDKSQCVKFDFSTDELKPQQP